MRYCTPCRIFLYKFFLLHISCCFLCNLFCIIQTFFVWTVHCSQSSLGVLLWGICCPRLSLIGLRFFRSAISIVFLPIPKVLAKTFLQTRCFWPLTLRVNALAICFHFMLGDPISACAAMKYLCLSYDCQFQYELKMSNRSSSFNLLLHLNLHFPHESAPRVLAGTVFPDIILVYSCPLWLFCFLMCFFQVCGFDVCFLVSFYHLGDWYFACFRGVMLFAS